jgi:ABC-2 type transport system ATP-binding protein
MESTPGISAAPASDLAIDARNLVKRFGTFKAVDDLSLQVPRGAFYAFLGPNGAGKSTTIALLTGIYRCDAGTIRVLDTDLEADPLEVKRRIGVVPEDLALFERLTGRQYLIFCGRMYGLSPEEAERRTKELLELTELTYKAESLVADYSKGMRRRIAIAAAVIHGPGMLFLDEPFEGIDVIASAVVRELLKELKRAGVTLFLTTHVLEIADRLATHAGVIRAGKLVMSGTVGELKRECKADDLEGVFNAVIGVPKAAGARLSWIEEAA